MYYTLSNNAETWRTLVATCRGYGCITYKSYKCIAGKPGNVYSLSVCCSLVFISFHEPPVDFLEKLSVACRKGLARGKKLLNGAWVITSNNCYKTSALFIRRTRIFFYFTWKSLDTTWCLQLQKHVYYGFCWTFDFYIIYSNSQICYGIVGIVSWKCYITCCNSQVST